MEFYKVFKKTLKDKVNIFYRFAALIIKLKRKIYTIRLLRNLHKCLNLKPYNFNFFPI